MRSIARLVLPALAFAACMTMPVTGREAFNFIPESQEMALGEESFQKVIAEEPVCKDPAVQAVVEDVGKRIAAVSGKPDWPWKFIVVKKDEVNAFCLPGGKVVVYTGILPVARDEAGLATVVGHEVSHAIARHGGQRLSEALLVNLGLQVADVSLQNSQYRDLILAGLGLGTQVGVDLPYSRSMESEADDIGLELMARAGYDPSLAVGFWDRMRQKAGGGMNIELLSDHPATERRIEDLKSRLSRSETTYQSSARLGAGKPLPVATSCP